MINNLKAMNALMRDDFEQAQENFRKECHISNSYQAYNNLGVFYIENGVLCKNGKIINGSGVGKRLLQKSLLICESSKALNNLGYIEYDLGNYTKSLEFWERSYKLNQDVFVLYNIAVTLYMLGDYFKAMRICEKLVDDVDLAKQLYVFSCCMHDNTNFNILCNQKNDIVELLDVIDKTYLYYQIGKYDKVVELESVAINTNFDYSEDQLAILYDSYVRCGITPEKKRIFKENHIDKYSDSYAKALWNKIVRMDTDLEYREKFLSECVFLPAVFDEECHYFGCPLHKTPW